MHTSRRLLAALLPAAALTLVGFSAQAQNYYTTNFSSADTGLSASGSTYSSPATTPTDPLAGQNGWASNDGTVTAGSGTSQIVGDSNFVGQYGQYFGGGTNFAAVTGGAYRVSNPSAAIPDVVPSATNAPLGIISLYHPITFVPSTGLALNLDFVVTLPGIQGYTARDSFAFTLGNGSTNLLTINFSQSVDNPATQDTLTLATGANNLGQGGTTTATNYGIVLNAQYHLGLTITNLATGAFTLTLQGQTGGALTVNGSAGAAFTTTSLTQFGTLWNLQNKTATNGAFQGAGDNVLAFDNVSLAVPEPSTYALLLVAAAAGWLWTARLRRKQA